MPKHIGFDNEKYLQEQTAAILERVDRFHNKLYLEFGGKLLFDYHAARVLPGFDPNVKMRLLQQLKDKADILLCIYAGDIERKKMRADFGITYDADALKLIDDLRDWGIDVCAPWSSPASTTSPPPRLFKNKLERRGVRVYTHRSTKGYPTDVDTIVSDEGYGANAYIETDQAHRGGHRPRPRQRQAGHLPVASSTTSTGAACSAGYAKFETFPIWNLPLKHPVNVAYEAATADLKDFNLIDPFHLEAHGVKRGQLQPRHRGLPPGPAHPGEDHRRAPWSTSRPPTWASTAPASASSTTPSCARPPRRRSSAATSATRASTPWAWWTRTRWSALRAAHGGPGREAEESRTRGRPGPASRRRGAERRGKGNDGIFCGAAIELADGTIVTGKNSPLMHAASSLVLNAAKHLAGIPDSIHLLPPSHHRVAGPLEEGHAEGAGGEPEPGRDADRPGHQRHRQPGRPGGGGEALRAAQLRGAHDPHAHARRRGRPAQAGGQPDLRPGLFQPALFAG